MRGGHRRLEVTRMLVLLLFVHSLVTGNVCASSSDGRFMSCPERKLAINITDTVTSRSKIQCATLCSQNTDCSSACYRKHSKNNNCDLSTYKYDGEECSSFPLDSSCSILFLKKSCLNGGYLGTGYVCICPNGFDGELCQNGTTGEPTVSTEGSMIPTTPTTISEATDEPSLSTERNTIPTTPTTVSNCSADFTLDVESGVCYRFGTENRIQYNESKLQCESFPGAHLLSSALDQAFLERLTAIINASTELSKAQRFYVDGEIRTGENTWYGWDGSPLVYPPAVWEEDQPNGPMTSDYCTCIGQAVNYLLNDVLCSKPGNYVCQENN